MIHDVDQLLEKLVKKDALNGSSVELVFEAPTKDWVARRSGPAVDLYLYDIREDLERRVPAWEDVKDAAGERTTDRRLPPRRYRLAYLVTAWTQRPRTSTACPRCRRPSSGTHAEARGAEGCRAEPARLH
jgi:hypothetical protein